MKIAYLHGLESSINPEDPKIIWLNDNFKDVYTPTIDYKNPGSFKTILRTIKNMDPDCIVGSSMGGYFAYLIGSKLGIKTVLFNPAVVGRSFDPVVDDIDTKGRNGHNLFLGKNDKVINGNDIRKFFGDSGMANVNTDYYNGGHRVPADVFISSIKKVTGVSEIYNVQNNIKMMNKFEQFINEKREDVGKYNTVKKVIAELGRRPSEQDLATFINNNYYDVTEVERGEDDPTANDKIADLVAFYKFDIDDWEIAWTDAQNESVHHSLQTNKINESETVYHKYDFEGMWAQKLGMTREEYVAHFATMTVGVDEAMATDARGTQFDVKGINFTYTDVGRFYGVYLYDVPKTSNVQWRAKLSLSEITEFLRINNIKQEVPVRYDEKDLDKICKSLSKLKIVCDYDDSFDVS